MLIRRNTPASALKPPNTYFSQPIISLYLRPRVNFAHLFPIGITHLQLYSRFQRDCATYRWYCHNSPQVFYFPIFPFLFCYADRSCTTTTNIRRSTVVTVIPNRNCISFSMRCSLGSRPLPSTASYTCGKLGITKHLRQITLPDYCYTNTRGYNFQLKWSRTN